MIVLAIILAVIIFLVFLRIGVSAEYSSDGVVVKARIGPLPVRIYPRKVKKKEPEKKKKQKKEKKVKKVKEEPEAEKPGKAKTLLNILRVVKNVLGRLRRRLLVKKLIIRYVAAGEDPSKTALAFGSANAAFGVIIYMLESMFRIKRRDLRAVADFEAAESSLYLKVVISIAVWEAVYILFALLPLLSTVSNKPTVSSVRKDV